MSEQRRFELEVLREAVDWSGADRDWYERDPNALQDAVRILIEHDGGWAAAGARLEAELASVQPQVEEPQWVARTAEDVREGDLVRLPAAPDLHARVVFAQPLDWHVRPGGDGHRARFDDVPLEHRKVSLRLEYAGAKLDFAGRPVLMELPAGTPVEIQLIPSELQAIEAIGWPNRIRTEAGR
jgi:hypothetical protein